MKSVAELIEGNPGGWIMLDALHIDFQGVPHVDLDSTVIEDRDFEGEGHPEGHPVRVRRNWKVRFDRDGELIKDESLIEVPYADLKDQPLSLEDLPEGRRWHPVTLWFGWYLE